MLSLRLRSALFAATLAGSLVAHATTINFNAQAVGHPSAFDGTVNSPLTLGLATFTGGELLINETNSVDLTGVYATSNLSGGPYSNIKIAFSSAVNGFSLLLTNNITDSFTVSDNLGDTLTSVLAQNSMHTFTLAGSGITSVNIKEAGSSFDYAIDNVTFDATTAVTPEPSSLVLLGTGIVGVVGAARRRFAA